MEDINRGAPVDMDELVMSNMISIEALVAILVKKGVCSMDEILGAVEVARADMVERVQTHNKMQ